MTYDGLTLKYQSANAIVSDAFAYSSLHSNSFLSMAYSPVKKDEMVNINTGSYLK